MATKETNLILVVLLCFLSFISPFQASTDTIRQGQQLRDSEELFSADGYFRKPSRDSSRSRIHRPPAINYKSPFQESTDTILQGQQQPRDPEELVSADGYFRLGFFSPGSSKNRYLGIFYSQYQPNIKWIQNAVWVANRNTPISDRSGILVIDEYGKMKISYGGGNHIVLSSVEGASNASATLLDTGNFMLRELNSDGSTKRILWQSFDYPTDTLLPGMKLGTNFKTGHTWSLISWISENVPTPGSFKLGVGAYPSGTSQLIIWWQGKVYWSSGIWLNGQFKQVPMLSSNSKQNWSYTSNENETYFTYSMYKKYTFPLYKMESTGQISTGEGTTTFSECYLFHYGSHFSTQNSHFSTQNDYWSRYGHYADAGCEKKETLPECKKNIYIDMGEGVVIGYGFKFDDSHNLSRFDCLAKCMNNCSCVAFASINANGTGCELWGQEMNFIRIYDISPRRTIYFFIPGQGKITLFVDKNALYYINCMTP